MDPISLNLVVIRSADTARSAAFYTQLGFQFTKHRHGNGPEHYAAEIGGAVFEIYPLDPNGKTTQGLRIGFRVPSIEAILAIFAENPSVILSPPKDSEWGRRAVIADPDGHRIELLEGA